MQAQTEKPVTIFNPLSYIKMYYNLGEGPVLQSGLYNKFQQWTKQAFDIIPECQNGIEIGCGPILNLSAYASRKIKNIILTEYNSQCFKYISAWVRQLDNGYKLDWSKYFQVIGQHQGTQPKAVADRLRKAIVQCLKIDLKTDQVFQWPFFRKVDVIMSSLCIECASTSDETYKNMMKKLKRYLKPNGYIYLFGVLEQSFYHVMEQKLICHPLTEQLIRQALTQAGFEIVKMNTFEIYDPSYIHSNLKGAYSVLAKLTQP